MLNHGIKPSHDASEKWIGLAFMTSALFVFCDQRNVLGNNRGLFAIYSGTFLLILLNVEHWGWDGSS